MQSRESWRLREQSQDGQLMKYEFDVIVIGSGHPPSDDVE